ncbi:hypothetical protein [Undibacterium sp. YM2]|uniref:hypothetical protein n=1 Tax=Undibacterium sp. YM2 TaxID=2058625 RepID=UPI00138A64C4|nr:hypothetical protein [Undibacterium sp. YM2]
MNHIGKTLARIRIGALDFWWAIVILMLDFAKRDDIEKKSGHAQNGVSVFFCCVGCGAENLQFHALHFH